MFKYLGCAEKFLRPGAVGIIPTDTIYGLAARAADAVAVARLYELKMRDRKPGTIIAANIDQLVALGIKRRYLKAVEQFWPGAVSVIILCSAPELDYLHQGQQSLAVRIPDKNDLVQLLQQSGPLLTSSANHSGAAPANTLAEAKIYFGNEVNFYVDGGDLSDRKPSTLIRIIDDAIEVLRPGAVQLPPSNSG